MVDLAEMLRAEIKARGLSQYQIAQDTKDWETQLDQPGLSQFLAGADMRLKKASVLLTYLGFKVIKPKRQGSSKKKHQFAAGKYVRTPKPKS